MDKYRVGIIGCGGMGTYLASTFQQLPQAEVVALAEVDEQRLAQVGKQLQVKALYTDYRIMLEKERLNVVVIATHAPDHCAPTIAAAALGCHILCEKPMATSLEECDRMIAACERAKVQLAVHQQFSFGAAAQKLKALVSKGMIGALRMMRMWGKGYPAPYDLMEIACHIFDMGRRVVGAYTGKAVSEVEWVFAHVTQGGRDIVAADVIPSSELHPKGRDCGIVAGDTVIAYCWFQSGVSALGEFYTLTPPRNDYMGIELIGTNGMLRLQGSLLEHLFFHPMPRAIPENLNAWQSLEAEKIVDYDPHDPMSALHFSPTRPLVEDFLKAIEEDRTPLISGYDGRAALEIVMAIYESQRLGRRVKLPLETRVHPLSLLKA